VTAIIGKWRVFYKTRRSPYLISNEGITEGHEMYRLSHLYNCPHLGPVFTISETTHILINGREEQGGLWQNVGEARKAFEGVCCHLPIYLSLCFLGGLAFILNLLTFKTHPV
jgi:hypothetical protein